MAGGEDYPYQRLLDRVTMLEHQVEILLSVVEMLKTMLEAKSHMDRTWSIEIPQDSIDTRL